MGNAESSSQPRKDEEEEETASSSALKIGAAVAGSALLALGAYTLASSSSSHSGDRDGGPKRLGGPMQNFEAEGFGSNNRLCIHGLREDYSSNFFASQRIKIMTYNVWLQERVAVGERMKAIGQFIEEHSPHIIFFQEVTPNIYRLFQASNWWRMYTCSVPPEKATGPPFCMLLSKLPVEEFFSIPFKNSGMGKEICFAEITAGANMELLAATSHFKSPASSREMNSEERVAQAKQAFARLDPWPNVIFGGDLNWVEKSDGALPLLRGWQDAWSSLRSGEDGWTYDNRSNPMLKSKRPLQKRLDRFLCKLQDFRMVDIDVIGMDAIPGISHRNNNGEELPVLPSDHYGLVLTICRI